MLNFGRAVNTYFLMKFMMKFRSIFFLTLAIVLTLAAIACGSNSEPDAATLAKITPSETIFTLDDLTAVGFKKNKEFNVEGLTGAISAYYGFWGLDPYDRKDYEVRFYPTYADAVEFGGVFADERTGTDAVIKTGENSWEEGAKEARSCVSLSSNSSCNISKYGDYVIYGNMILICEGRDSTTALGQCVALLEQLGLG